MEIPSVWFFFLFYVKDSSLTIHTCIKSDLIFNNNIWLHVYDNVQAWPYIIISNGEWNIHVCSFVVPWGSHMSPMHVRCMANVAQEIIPSISSIIYHMLQRVYEILWKICFTIFLILMIWSNHKFAHVMTAVMTCANLWPDLVIIVRSRERCIFFRKLALWAYETLVKWIQITGTE